MCFPLHTSFTPTKLTTTEVSSNLKKVAEVAPNAKSSLCHLKCGSPQSHSAPYGASIVASYICISFPLIVRFTMQKLQIWVTRTPKRLIQL
jgi:hypothetical protein